MRLVGVDEVGRGPLAGPVVAAAVVLKAPIAGLNDSKKLSAKRRAALESQILDQALDYAIVEVDPATIDQINILQASLLAMQRAVEQLTTPYDEVWVDGNRAPALSAPTRAIVGGDGSVAEISAASIIAKEYRDRLMRTLHHDYPVYGFDRHMGYPTAMHRAALLEHGPCAAHRLSFAPVRKLLSS